MNKNGNPAKGYYSILQFVPDLERTEGANIGVVLFCPEKGFLKAQTARGNDRVRRFFGTSEDSDLDLERVNIFKTAFEERVQIETKRIHSLEDFRHFVDTRGNHLLLTVPKSIKVFDPKEELHALFERLVGGRKHRPTKQSKISIAQIRKRFDEMLTKRGVSQKVQRNVTFESKVLGETIEFPFAYTNGQPNVIQTVVFESPKESKHIACQLAIEGDELKELPNPIVLNVLGSFSSSLNGTEEQVRALLKKYEVHLFTPENVHDLVEIIAETAH